VPSFIFFKPLNYIELLEANLVFKFFIFLSSFISAIFTYLD